MAAGCGGRKLPFRTFKGHGATGSPEKRRGVRFTKGGEFKVLAECPGGMTEEEIGKNDEGDLIR